MDSDVILVCVILIRDLVISDRMPLVTNFTKVLLSD